MTETGPAAIEDDASVIAASRQDPERFAALFQRYAPQIARYAARRLGPAHADDIVADTFLAAFRQRGSYDLERADALPWLYGIATRLIKRQRRAEVRGLRALARTGADPVMEPFTDRIDSRVAADAVSRDLARAIAALPAAHRDVLLLLTWAELTYDQVAEALGVAPGTVRSRMNRTRKKLRQALGGADPTDVREETRHG